MTIQKLRRLVAPLAVVLGLAALAASPVLAKDPPKMDDAATPVEHDDEVFRDDPDYGDHDYDPEAQAAIYGGKHLNRTARPPVELGLPLYAPGEYRPAGTWMGRKNPTQPWLYAYGDLRTTVAWNDNGASEQGRLATRLNLDLDFGFTATERIHVFARPFDQGGSFLRYDFAGDVDGEFVEEFDFNLDAAFFEGDMGPIARGFSGKENTLDLPFSVGLVPMLTQNGVWMQDAFWGAAVAVLPARNSPKLDISNFDLTLFAGFDKVSTVATADPDHGANLYGFAAFAEANKGYWEGGVGVIDSDVSELSYVNASIAFTRRYKALLSNSIRLIGNFGQDDLPAFDPRRAEGFLLLLENSIVSSKPVTQVPYFNLFVGFDRPQPLVRDPGAGGILAQEGILFETDGVTGFPTLDPTAADAYGGAFGYEWLFNLERQLVLEVAALDRFGDRSGLGSEYGVGVRFQEPLNNAWILRFDAMHGWRDVGDDLFGVRVEIRRKF